MAILSTLCSISQPGGMWETIIWAFEGATKNYVWAVVLLTVIIRLIWSPLETYNRRISVKNAKMNAKIQPELKKLQEKYANDKQTLNQKTNELYKRNNFNVMGSCVFMLVFMALNLAIFFTLFAGLNNIASYKIYTNYENLKDQYANTLYLTNQNEGENIRLFKEKFDADTEVEFRVWTNEAGKKQIGLFEKATEETSEEDAIFNGDFLTIEDFEKLDTLDEENKNDKLNANDVLLPIIESFKNVTLKEIPAQAEGEEDQKITLLDQVTKAAEKLVADEYNATKEKFLWIENIWIADSPFKNSVFSYSEFASNTRGKVQDGEEQIYNLFMQPLRASQSRVNGYFILPILTLAVSFLSMWLSQRLMTGKDKQKGVKKQGLAMQIIMPIIMGVFAILYNSVFAIYMLVSQIISTALMPLQQLIVQKIEERSEKKKMQTQNPDTDYRRKV